MHFEILVEDPSGKKALEILIPKILGDQHTFNIHPYKGIGHIPKNLKKTPDPKNRMLLSLLPSLLQAHGKTFNNYPENYAAALIVICDLDNKCLKSFRNELFSILNACNPKPETRFCIAVEEGEAWFLGDISAIKTAYSKAKGTVLNEYENDSICGTWEVLADAIYPGGSNALLQKGYPEIGNEKSRWAKTITPHMDVGNNLSPSFCYFLQKLRELVGENRN